MGKADSNAAYIAIAYVGHARFWGNSMFGYHGWVAHKRCQTGVCECNLLRRHQTAQGMKAKATNRSFLVTLYVGTLLLATVT